MNKNHTTETKIREIRFHSDSYSQHRDDCSGIVTTSVEQVAELLSVLAGDYIQNRDTFFLS